MMWVGRSQSTGRNYRYHHHQRQGINKTVTVTSLLLLVSVWLSSSTSFITLVQSTTSDVTSPPSDGPNVTTSTTTTTTTATPSQFLSSSLPNRSYGFWDPDVELMRQQYWQRTLAEIRTLTQKSYNAPANTFNKRSRSPTPTKSTSTANKNKISFLQRWNALTTMTPSPPLPNISTADDAANVVGATADDVTTTTPFSNESFRATTDTPMATSSTSAISIPRFDGFPSWERLLNDWSDDVQEYLQQVNEEQSLGYSIGNYGRAPTTATSTTTAPLVPPPLEPVSILENTSSTTATEPVSILKNTSSTTATSSDTIVSTAASAAVTSKIIPPPIVVKTVSSLPLPIPAPAKPGDAVLDYTDISNKTKRILIVTTASLPWKTGTAVNPLLRAAYLSQGRREVGGNVTLMIPWLERPVDQMSIYGKNNIFATQDEQEQYIRNWLNESANMVEASQDLHIEWYTAWQNKVENSIYSMGDLTANLSSTQYDICILEEPEHLNWYRAPGESWTKKFPHVVGILHTNYFSYALDQPAALIRAPAMRLLCSWMCRAHCHRVIKLSATLDQVAPEKELVENVHGVRGTFLDIGAKVRTMLLRQQQLSLAFIPSITTTADIPWSESVFRADSEPTIYFIGKMLWSKGLGSLMELLKYAEESAALRVAVDMYGGGPDMEAASKKADKLNLNMTFRGPLDHAELAYTHKIFVNPSTSEVLCTTSAEALAMGKFVIIPSHPSNDFFAQFPNCLTYATKEEFVGELYYAMTHTPEPLSDEHAFALSWEAATQRLEAAGCITVEENEQMQQALSSEAAGIEIALPPIVENEESRKEISKVFRFSRLRYRQFRTRLSQEIQESKGTINICLAIIHIHSIL